MLGLFLFFVFIPSTLSLLSYILFLSLAFLSLLMRVIPSRLATITALTPIFPSMSLLFFNLLLFPPPPSAASWLRLTVRFPKLIACSFRAICASLHFLLHEHWRKEKRKRKGKEKPGRKGKRRMKKKKKRDKQKNKNSEERYWKKNGPPPNPPLAPRRQSGGPRRPAGLLFKSCLLFPFLDHSPEISSSLWLRAPLTFLYLSHVLVYRRPLKPEYGNWHCLSPLLKLRKWKPKQTKTLEMKCRKQTDQF